MADSSPITVIAPVATIGVYEKLHAKVRALQSQLPGAEVYYKYGPISHEAVVIVGGRIFSIRDDGAFSSTEIGEWS